MATSTVKKSRRRPEPTWEIAHLFPFQGMWSEEEFLDLDTNHLVELSNGFVEVLPMPTTWHQLIVLYFYRLLDDFVKEHDLGMVLAAPLRIRLWAGTIREPDVVFMKAEHADRIHDGFWDRADLAMEVVSTDGRDRDLVIKRREFAKAGIPEYWIIDPKKQRLLVLRLKKKTYAIHGDFTEKGTAQSALLPGFSVAVQDVFAAGKRKYRP